METTAGEQPGIPPQDVPPANTEQEHTEEAMEEGEEYGYEGDEYRHYMPRGRGGFRSVF